jgi:uncharacterized protein
MTTQISQTHATNPIAHAPGVPQSRQQELLVALKAVALMAHARRLVEDGAKPATLVQLAQEMCDLQSLLSLLQTNKCFRPERLQLTAIFQSYRPHLGQLFNPTLRVLIKLGRKSELAETETPTLSQCKVLVAQLEQPEGIKRPGVRYSGSGTPLHQATVNDDVPSIDALCIAGANVEAPTADPWSHGRTPLSLAVAYGCRNAASRLVALGADINANSGHPVYMAAKGGHLDLLQLLIKAKASIQCPTDPLAGAAVGNRVDAMGLLLAAGADPHKGQTLVHAAAAGALDALDLLLRHKVDVDALVDDKSDHSEVGFTALTTAALRGNAEIVARLLAARATVDTPDSRGITALSRAVSFRYSQVVQQLLDAGASVNKPDAEGRTPLSIANHQGQATIAQLLLDYRAEPSIADNGGRTPRAHAAGNATTATVAPNVKSLSHTPSTQGDRS